MESRPPLSLADQFAAACDWWREAGVDQDFLDEPEKLLKAPEVQSRQARAAAEKVKAALEAEAQKPMIGGEKSAWPTSLEDFQQWWMTEPSLDEAGTQGRVAPRGPKGADLMVIVPMPEADDRDRLLSAGHGKLISNMLRAMEVNADKAYLASALPRHMPLADWAGPHAAGLGEIMLRHMELAAPKRVLVLGRDLMPLLGQEKRQGVCDLALAEGSIQLLASFAPENLVATARLRADLWRRWLDWTGNA